MADSDEERTEIARPCRLPIWMRRVRVGRRRCWFCDSIFTVRHRKVGKNADGHWLYGDVHGNPTEFMYDRACPHCMP